MICSFLRVQHSGSQSPFCHFTVSPPTVINTQALEEHQELHRRLRALVAAARGPVGQHLLLTEASANSRGSTAPEETPNEASGNGRKWNTRRKW